jgi:hypothetical protein
VRAGLGQGDYSHEAADANEPILIELPRDLLQILCLLPATETREQLTDLFSNVARRYGVTPPPVRLTVAAWADPVLRLRFAGLATPAFLVNDGDPQALREELLGLLDLELPRHLDLWVSDDPDPWTTRLFDLPRTADMVASHLPALRRRLVADGVSVVNDQVLVEAILRVLAGSTPETEVASMVLLDGMEDQARVSLGPAVLDPMTMDYAPQIIDIGDLVVRGRSPGEIRQEVLAGHPELTTTLAPVVLRVSGSIRREVARAMRAMSDTISVASAEELQINVAMWERWATTAGYQESQVEVT